MQRAVIYARVSTDDAEQATSIPNQIEACRREAKRSGLQVIVELSDTKSGKSFDRPGWKQLERLIHGRQIDVILCTARDRISRNHLEYMLMKRDLLDPAQVIIQPLSGVQQVKDDDPNFATMESIEMVFSEWYRKQISWKTIQAMRRLAEAGLWRHRPPYGTVAGKLKGIPIKHPITWAYAERLFEMAASGMSIPSIAKQFNAEHIPAPDGGDWSIQTMRQLIANHFYIGEIHLLGEVFRAKHDCLIPLATWEAAQLPRSMPSQTGKPSEFVYLLSNVVTDLWVVTHPPELAGKPVPMYAKYCIGRGGKKYYYYYRADKLKACGGIKAAPDHLEAEAMRSSVSARDLEYIVIEELIKHLRDPEYYRDLKAIAADSVRRISSEYAACEKEVVKAEKEKAKLGEMLTKEWMDTGVMPTYGNERYEALDKELATLQKQLGELKRESALLARQQTELTTESRSVNMIEELWRRGMRRELKLLMRELIKEVLVRHDEVVISLNVPVRSKTKKLPRTDSNHQPTG